MGRLILDTTLLVSSERRGSRLAIADDDDVAIAALTLAELRVGVLLASGKRRTSRAAYVDRIEQTLHVEDYTADVADAHAELLAATRRSGRPRGAHDLIIAATAISSRRTLLTSDARGFVDLPGLTLETTQG